MCSIIPWNCKLLHGLNIHFTIFLTSLKILNFKFKFRKLRKYHSKQNISQIGPSTFNSSNNHEQLIKIILQLFLLSSFVPSDQTKITTNKKKIKEKSTGGINNKQKKNITQVLTLFFYCHSLNPKYTKHKSFQQQRKPTTRICTPSIYIGSEEWWGWFIININKYVKYLIEKKFLSQMNEHLKYF